MLHDRGAVPQRIAPYNAHGARDQHIHAGSDFSGGEQRFTGGIAANSAKSANAIDFLRRKRWEHLLAAAIDRRHVRPRLLAMWAMRVSSQALPKIESYRCSRDS